MYVSASLPVVTHLVLKMDQLTLEQLPKGAPFWFPAKLSLLRCPNHQWYQIDLVDYTKDEGKITITTKEVLIYK